MKGLADAPPQNKRPTPTLPQGPPPLKKARGGPPSLSAANPMKPSPLVTSHLANRLTQPRSQPAVNPARPKSDIVDPSELESHDSWHNESQDHDASVDSEEFKVYPDTDVPGDDDQFSHEQVVICDVTGSC